MASTSMPLNQPKVAIPRIQKPPIRGKDRRRVGRACTACRRHKIKCTGNMPQCEHCATTNLECVYIMPRKDKLKIVTEHCRQLASILRGLRNIASGEENAKITHLLLAVEEETSDITSPTDNSITETETHGSSTETIDFGSVGHPSELDTASLDRLDEDLHRDQRARATGFVGKNSEVQWLRTVALAQAEQAAGTMSAMAPPREYPYAATNDQFQVDNFSYWCDGDGVDSIENFSVDPYTLPHSELADRLLGCYMLQVHDSFPILPRKAFQDQFRRHFTSVQNGNTLVVDPTWHAILNLVFAIGAKHSHLVKARWRAHELDHSIYLARARRLGLHESITDISNHSTLTQIRALGLLAFYWLTTGQISRAWSIIGVALRFAFSLGLHVRNEDPSASASEKEMLVRTWWSLYSLERTLSIITGRPSSIVDSCCSAPLPNPCAEEGISDNLEATSHLRQSDLVPSPMNPVHLTFPTSLGYAFDPPSNHSGLGTPEANSGSYFRAAVQLSIITQHILTSLYSAGTTIRPPEEVQHEVYLLGQRMEQWIVSLPTEFNFQEPVDTSRQTFPRERMSLGFQLCSARILLTRPSLTGRRRSRRDSREANLASRMATDCVQSAKTIINLLPVEGRSDELYDEGPWWCLTHHVMQAVSVFLLALSYPYTTTHSGESLIEDTKTAIRWLQAVEDPVAKRAHQVALHSLEPVARRYMVDTSDIWMASTDEMMPVSDEPYDASAFPMHTQFVPRMSHPAGEASYPDYLGIPGTALSSHHMIPSFNEPFDMTPAC